MPMDLAISGSGLAVRSRSLRSMYGDLEDSHNLALAEIDNLKSVVAAKEHSIEMLEYRFMNVKRERNEALEVKDKLVNRPKKVRA